MDSKKSCSHCEMDERMRKIRSKRYDQVVFLLLFFFLCAWLAWRGTTDGFKAGKLRADQEAAMNRGFNRH